MLRHRGWRGHLQGDGMRRVVAGSCGADGPLAIRDAIAIGWGNSLWHGSSPCMVGPVRRVIAHRPPLLPGKPPRRGSRCAGDCFRLRNWKDLSRLPHCRTLPVATPCGALLEQVAAPMAASTLSPMVCASAASATACSVLVASSVPVSRKADRKPWSMRSPTLHPAQQHQHRHGG